MDLVKLVLTNSSLCWFIEDPLSMATRTHWTYYFFLAYVHGEQENGADILATVEHLTPLFLRPYHLRATATQAHYNMHNFVRAGDAYAALHVEDPHRF